jgi:hypothetical protein
MGYSEVDQLAINTIRLLAVCSLPSPIIFPRTALCIFQVFFSPLILAAAPELEAADMHPTKSATAKLNL